MLYKYYTGEEILLNDNVFVIIGGIEIPGKVVFIDGIQEISSGYKWCEDDKLEGIIVEWLDRDLALSILYNGNDPDSIANYIQINDFDDELVLNIRG
jgi:hypothetical protein